MLDEVEPTNLRPNQSKSQLRGPNCVDGTLETIAFSHQRPSLRHLRIAVFGFRVVLAKEGTKQEVE